MAHISIKGKRFAMLTGVDLIEGRTPDNHIKGLWQCDCGKTKEIAVSRVINGYTRSCGCLIAKNGITHGMKHTREYSSWGAAKSRCHNPDYKDYKKYGAKGISMCDEWRNSFEVFYSHMGPRPAGTSLDRWPNRNGNYEPGNCRWATLEEQAQNRDKSIWVVWHGEVKHLTVVAAELGITYGAAFQRLKRGKLYGAELHNH